MAQHYDFQGSEGGLREWGGGSNLANSPETVYVYGPREASTLIFKIRSCTGRTDLKNKAFSADFCLFFRSVLPVQDRILKISEHFSGFFLSVAQNGSKGSNVFLDASGQHILLLRTSLFSGNLFLLGSGFGSGLYVGVGSWLGSWSVSVWGPVWVRGLCVGVGSGLGSGSVCRFGVRFGFGLCVGVGSRLGPCLHAVVRGCGWVWVLGGWVGEGVRAAAPTVFF